GFRRRESELLRELAQLDRHVIATGGGVVMQKTNRDVLRTNGWVVWLDADTDTLWNRIQADSTTAERRPALTVGGREEVEQLRQQREPLYRVCAHLRVSANRDAALVAREIEIMQV